MAHLFLSLPLWQHRSTSLNKPIRARPQIATRLQRWGVGLWQSACRHAERPDRCVPRY